MNFNVSLYDKAHFFNSEKIRLAEEDTSFPEDREAAIFEGRKIANQINLFHVKE